MGHEGSPEKANTAAGKHPADWFDRELAQLNAQLDDIAAWLKTRPATPAPLPVWRPSVSAASLDANGPSVPIGRGLAASAQPDEPVAGDGSGGRPDRHDLEAAPGAAPADHGSAAPAPAAAASASSASAAAAPSAPPLPTGTDLSDPKNFGMMPPVADLEQGSASAEDYRQRLGKHLAFATTVLHTSKVPAAVWREWRAFEKSIHDRLLALSRSKVER